MYAIPASLILVGGGLAALRNRQGAALAAILLSNWAACALFYGLTDQATEWMALAAFDYPRTPSPPGATRTRRSWSSTATRREALRAIADVATARQELSAGAPSVTPAGIGPRR